MHGGGRGGRDGDHVVMVRGHVTQRGGCREAAQASRPGRVEAGEASPPVELPRTLACRPTPPPARSHHHTTTPRRSRCRCSVPSSRSELLWSLVEPARLTLSDRCCRLSRRDGRMLFRGDVTVGCEVKRWPDECISPIGTVSSAAAEESPGHTTDARSWSARSRWYARARRQVTPLRVSFSAGFKVSAQVLPEVHCDKRVRCFCESVQSPAGDASCLTLTRGRQYVRPKQKLTACGIYTSIAFRVALLLGLFTSCA